MFAVLQCLQHFECRLYSVIVTQRIWMSFLNIPMLCQLPSHAWRGIEASRVTGTWERADYSWARYWRTWSSHHNSSLYPEVRNRWTSLRKCQKYVRQTKIKLIFKINYWCMLPSSKWNRSWVPLSAISFGVESCSLLRALEIWELFGENAKIKHSNFHNPHFFNLSKTTKYCASNTPLKAQK